MEALQIMPAKAGQICRITHLMPDEDPDAVYIISEDPSAFDAEDSIYITDLRELQRNINNPLLAPNFAVPKGSLSVVAENIEEYIASWNNN